MTSRQLEAITRHGQQLLAIFPQATERDPVKLCKRLRALESRGIALGLRLCNGPEMTDEEADRITADILTKLNALLAFRESGPTPIINRDPRGYALKIHDEDMRAGNLALHRDWGGYGILAPEFGKDGE